MASPLMNSGDEEQGAKKSNDHSWKQAALTSKSSADSLSLPPAAVAYPTSSSEFTDHSYTRTTRLVSAGSATSPASTQPRFRKTPTSPSVQRREPGRHGPLLARTPSPRAARETPPSPRRGAQRENDIVHSATLNSLPLNLIAGKEFSRSAGKSRQDDLRCPSPKATRELRTLSPKLGRRDLLTSTESVVSLMKVLSGLQYYLPSSSTLSIHTCRHYLWVKLLLVE